MTNVHLLMKVTKKSTVRCVDCDSMLPWGTEPCPKCGELVCPKCDDPIEGTCLACPRRAAEQGPPSFCGLHRALRMGHRGVSWARHLPQGLLRWAFKMGRRQRKAT